MSGLKIVTKGVIDDQRMRVMSAFINGYSVSANPDYIRPGVKEVLDELVKDGWISLDVSAIPIAKKDQDLMDPGDLFGRYRAHTMKVTVMQDRLTALEFQMKANRKK